MLEIAAGARRPRSKLAVRSLGFTEAIVFAAMKSGANKIFAKPAQSVYALRTDMLGLHSNMCNMPCVYFKNK